MGSQQSPGPGVPLRPRGPEGHGTAQPQVGLGSEWPAGLSGVPCSVPVGLHLMILILHSHWLCDLSNIITAGIGQVFRYKWAASCLQGKTAGNTGAGVPGGGEFYLLPVTPHMEHRERL